MNVIIPFMSITLCLAASTAKKQNLFFFFGEIFNCFAYNLRKAIKACDQKRNLGRAVIYFPYLSLSSILKRSCLQYGILLLVSHVFVLLSVIFFLIESMHL